ncbi:hypothetical protein MXB_387, partial [Myxobolus squamalis]
MYSVEKNHDLDVFLINLLINPSYGNIFFMMNGIQQILNPFKKSLWYVLATTKLQDFLNLSNAYVRHEHFIDFLTKILLDRR